MSARIHSPVDFWITNSLQKTAAFDHDGNQFNFVELGERIHSLAAELKSRGVHPGNRVMLAGENSVAHIVSVLACSRLDAWVIPVNARLTASEIQNIRDHSRPCLEIFTQGVSENARAHGEAAGAQSLKHESLKDLWVTETRDTEPEPVFESAEEQVAMLIYTTGTTGSPKGVMVTHANTLHNIKSNQVVRNVMSNDCVYPAAPHTHIMSLTAAIAGLASGASVVFLPRFEPEKVFAAIANGVTIFQAVPAMYNGLLKYADEQGWDCCPQGDSTVSKLKYISAGGAPLDPTWKSRVEAFFGLPLQNGYGLTEATPIVAATRYDDAYKTKSVGTAPPGVEIKIDQSKHYDPENPLVGEVLCRGANVMKGYYQDPELTSKTIDAEGFLHTGDIGWLDSDGSLTLEGRLKDVIIRSGFNVYPEEVETVLNMHNGVKESVVVGHRSGDGNEIVLAFVEPMADQSLEVEELSQFVSERLAGYKKPACIFVVDALPRAPTGKVLKARILETFHSRMIEAGIK